MRLIHSIRRRCCDLRRCRRRLALRISLNVLLTEALETPDRKIEVSRQLIGTQDTSATTPNRRQFHNDRLGKL